MLFTGESAVLMKKFHLQISWVPDLPNTPIKPLAFTSMLSELAWDNTSILSVVYPSLSLPLTPHIKSISKSCWPHPQRRRCEPLLFHCSRQDASNLSLGVLQ